MLNIFMFFNQLEEFIVEFLIFFFDYVLIDVFVLIFEYVNYVFFLFFIVMGIVGNFLIIVVMCSECFVGFLFFYFLIVFVIFDLVVIFFQLFNKLFFIDLVGMDIRVFYDINCKLYIMI